MGFSERLRELREKKKLTQTQLGKLFNLSKQTISSYEKGGSKPSQDTLIKIAEFFEVSLYYLLGLSDDPTLPQPKKNGKPTFNQMVKHVLDAVDTGEAWIKISELNRNHELDLQTVLKLHELSYRKFGLKPAKHADKNTAHLKKDGEASGVFEKGGGKGGRKRRDN
jgi:transcriptional regulator with XRE-family HTH domain